MRSSVDPDEARRAARDILSGAEYAPPEETPVERAVSWLFDRLGDAIGTLTGGGPGSVIGWTLVVGLVGGATWLLVRALRVPGVQAGNASDAVRYGTESHRDASVWLAEAERLVAAGDHRGAIRCRYQALLATMISEQVVDDVPGRTSGEYRSLLSVRLPDVASVVADTTRRFEDVWYGAATSRADDFRSFSNACLDIEAAGSRVLATA